MTMDYGLGDKVRIIRQVSEDCTTGAVIGETAEIAGEFDGVTYPVLYSDGAVFGFLTRRSIEPIDGRYHNARLTEAEAKIAALEAEVRALKQAVTPEITVKVDAAAIVKAFEPGMFPHGVLDKAFERYHESRRPAKSPNQRRADVIKRAQAFVADLEERASSTSEYNDDGNTTFNRLTTRLTFHVNPEKGVVTALAHGSRMGRLGDKAFAKCHPNDVFNADIGKAIAAGKLYGVDIPQEFVDAPLPTEPVVGMRVKRFNQYGDDLGDMQVKSIRKVIGDEFCVNPKTTHAMNGGAGYCEAYGDYILEDTNAVYV